MTRWFAVATLALASCVYTYGTRISDEQLRALQVGRTTYAEIVAQWGPPIAVSRTSDGTSFASYSYTRAAAGAAESFVVMLTFDATGVLSKHSTVEARSPVRTQ